MFFFFFFFFKQKTAYEIRIRDWSSDVCSSDLVPYKSLPAANTDLAGGRGQMGMLGLSSIMPLVRAGKIRVLATHGDARAAATPDRSEERRVGKEC